ncbi:MAG: cytochrome c family protein [Gemmataceae bacterium]|nr:cytochrome c family protein [Gemmataceae bacterium]
MLPRKITWGLVLTGTLVGIWFFSGLHALLLSQAPSSGASAAGMPDLKSVVGTSSCSGRACHGGIEPVAGSNGLPGEYTTYILKDPHALKAFAVLNTDRSRIMVRNLRHLPEIQDAQPQKDALCLSCHGQGAEPSSQRQWLDDGFGCESCHGASRKWLEPHTSVNWKHRTAEDKQALGFVPLTSMSDRARACTQCHVGTGERQVDHDLIAAGHPRLNFEFSTYLANLPRHWQPDKDKDLASAWWAGQSASAGAALELLAYRADARNKRPWPEFAEYDCFACHHDLKADSTRIKRGYPDRVPGTLPWSAWYTTMPLALIDQTFIVNTQTVHNDFARLRGLMQQPYPNREKVAQEAHALAKFELAMGKGKSEGIVLNLHKHIPDAIDKDGRFFVKKGDATLVADWDVAAQMALAIRAEYEARATQDPKKRDPEAEKAIAALFELLQFPVKTGKEPMQFDSPPNFDPKEFVIRLQAACKAVAP